jgi:FkbM family methyltransferase
MRKVYLDLGGNKGQGLRSFISRYNINPSEWIVETFEPDPNCDIENNISDLKYVNINKKAIWVNDGKIQFSQMLENTEGSSVECLMSKGVCSDPNSESFRKHDSIIEVECVDISSLLKKYIEYDFVLVKMDIEGSEFKVLRKMLDDDTINIVSHLYVEWHHNYVNGEDESTVNDLKNKIVNRGIELYEWH